MEKGSEPNKHVLEAAKYLLDNSQNIAHSASIVVDKAGNLNIHLTGNIPKPLLCMMSAFFSEVSRQYVFSQPKKESSPVEDPSIKQVLDVVEAPAQEAVQ